jgi:outer membrane lipoprotein-sorting protein
MKKTMLLLMLIWLSGNLQAMDGQQIHEKMRNRDAGKTMHSIMKMTLIDKNGESKDRVIETWTMKHDEANDLSQSVMEFKSPATVKGTRFLQIQNKDRDDDQWIFLPALNRVRRIAATEGNASFMGSDFTYDDMKLQGSDDATHTLLREEAFEGRDCYVLESKDPDSKSYSKLISWITKEHFIPVKVEFYDLKSGELSKVMTIEGEVEKIDGVWTVFTTRMKSLKEEHQTLLEVLRNKSGAPFIEYNKPINPARFTQNYLQTGK